MLALSIRQPFAELILRGIKTIEYRTRPTRIVGQRFWIYASKGQEARGEGAEKAARMIWSNDLAIPGPKSGEPPEWLMELAEQLILDKLPRGVIVGSAVIERCEKIATQRRSDQATQGEARGHSPLYAWRLRDVQRARTLRKPTGHPQPVWFRPF